MKKLLTPFVVLVSLLACINNANAQCTTLLYRDADGDGLGNPNISMTSCYSRSGYVSNNSDCDDSNHSAGLVKLWYEDFDGDGYGNPNVTVSSCTQPPGYVELGIDEYDSNSYLLFVEDEIIRYWADYPYRSAVITHYADCSLNEDNIIKISQSPIRVSIYNEQGVLISEATSFINYLPNPYYVAVPPGSHAKITYYFATRSNHPNRVDGEPYIEYYDDFYFEKCTSVSGPQSVCEGAAITLTSQKDLESVFTWYDAQTGGNLLYTGQAFQTPGLKSGLYTYWVSADGGPRRSFTVTSIGPVIHSRGDTTVAASANSCSAAVNFKNPYAIEPCLGTGSVVFHGTGAYQNWVVPQNVYSVNVDAVGAASGGNPGRVQTTLAVTPGESLYINVADGSYPNGGIGATERAFYQGGVFSWSAGSGGGSTQVGRTGSLLTDTLIVAGGGGGSANSYFDQGGEAGGNGGYVADANPADPNFMHGMNALPDEDPTDLVVSGGGGGGYFGGLTQAGSGGYPGQGGGSHVAATGTSNTIFTQGFTGNSSYVQLTYTPELPMTQTEGLPSGSRFPIGTTPMKFKYTNGNGVTDSTSFTVTVTGSQHTYYRDADEDGFGSATNTTTVCSTSTPTGYVTDNTDCDDTRLLYADNDHDNYGAGSPVACGVPNNTDCADNNATVHPGAGEICGNGIDDNCNGVVDENCAVTYSLSVNDVSISEGNKGKSNMSFTVTLSKASSKKTTVQYKTQNGTAIAGSDYTAVSGTLTFKANTTKQNVAVSIIGDKIIEPNESFTVVLSSPVNATLSKSTGVGTIVNDDGGNMLSSISSNSLEILAPERSLTVAPNPATSILHATLQGFKGKVQLQLLDAHGRLLRQVELQTVPSSATRQRVDISSLANGIYFLSALDENGVRQTAKVVVEK